MKKEICKNCNFYSAYYHQFSSGYSRLNNGFCSKHNKQQIFNDTCEQFVDNEKREMRHEKYRLENLDRALHSLNEIAMIMKEKQENPGE